MKKILVFTFLVLNSLNSISQNGWEWLNPKPTGYLGRDLFFSDDQNGWAIGVEGKIIHTSDGGENWNLQNSGTNEQLNKVFFLNESGGWIVGQWGLVLKTQDGGNNWNHVNFSHFYPLVDVQFLDVNTGWILSLDGYLYKTINGGIDWVLLAICHDEPTRDIHFVNENIGWIIGIDGAIKKTINGGYTWEFQNSPSSGLNSIYFLNEQLGWVAGQGRIHYTTDGGNNWLESETFVGEYETIDEIYFLNENEGWAINLSWGKLLYSEDGGISWIEKLVEIARPGQLAIKPNNNIWILCNGTICYSNDCGNNWSMQNSFYSGEIIDICFLDENIGYIIGDRKIFRSNNGGKNWDLKYEHPDVSFYDMHFLSPDTSWVSCSAGKLLQTTNGGNSWNYITTPYYGIYLCINVVDANRIRLLMYNQFIWTDNGGEDWHSEYFSGMNFFDMYFTDENNGWIVGNYGAIFKTVDGGKNWSPQQFPLSKRLNAVHFINSQKGIIVGEEGLILRTINGGETWTSEYSGVSNWLHDVFLTSENSAWVAGSSKILYSNDGGVVWDDQTFDDYCSLQKISFVNKNVGWMAGIFGIIISTSTAGINAVDELERQQVQYISCYPNPFKNEMTIKIEFETEGDVFIELYDIAGKYLGVIDNLQLSDGNNIIKWNGEIDRMKLNAGIYFLRLVTDNQKVFHICKIVLVD
ncbi:MAG: T9SS type A sorting domain-containing protein [Bacteroidales bacterium]|nr:T9SS type A sorting domain-containing protein [Bacteroidales bacterium]